MTGFRESTDFPTLNPLPTGGANVGGDDAFVSKIGPSNQPPIADAGADQVVEQEGPAGSNVTLNGSGSSDPDGDPLVLTWTGPFGAATGEFPTVLIPAGTHIVTLVVNDGTVDSAPDTVSITVQDKTPPVIIPPPDLTVLATGPFTVVPLGTATASDLVDGALIPAPDNTGPFPLGTTTVTWSATDSAGNTGTATQTVTVSTISFDPGVIWARAELKPGKPDKFKVRGNLVLGLTSNGIDTVTEYVTFTLGTFAETIPPGSFVRKEGRWVFKAPKTKPFSGIKQMVLRDSTELKLEPEHGDGEYEIKLKGVDLSGIDFSVPVPFSIQIADDLGEFLIPFDNSKPDVKIFHQEVDKKDSDDEIDKHEFEEGKK
ncbi:MAG: HYR domain-containing protein [Nitrospinaceae bacterium]